MKPLTPLEIELLEALKEVTEACAATFRVIALHHIETFGFELKQAGVKEGFGVRAKAAIAKAEGKS
jgi:hypothetical protein